MTRIFTSGAEEADPMAVWDYIDCLTSMSNVPGLVVAQGASAREVHASIEPRTGRGMYALDKYQMLRKDFGEVTTYDELYWGFAMNVPIVDSSSPFFYARNDDPGIYSNHVSVGLTADGRVSIVRYNGVILAQSVAGVVAANTWHYFEIYIKPRNSGGVVTVKVDGIQVVTYTGDTTGEEEFFNAWDISGVNASTSSIRPTLFDDIVCNDVNGSVNNSWPGMVRLLPVRANADGTYNDWTRAALDLGCDAAQVRGGFGVSMLQTASADQKVTFDPEIPDLPVGATITNVILSVTARVEAGAGVIAPMVISDATESISADQTLLSTWRNYQYAWAVNPADSAAWEEADLATLELGVSS